MDRGGGTGFVVYLCPSQSVPVYKSGCFQIYSVQVQKWILSATTVSHSPFFLQISFFFFPPLSAGNPESHPGLFSSCRTAWWFAVSLKPGKFPMEANGAPVAFQTVDFCHFLCKMDSISPWRQKPLFCWVTLQNNRQLQKSWYALFLVPVFTLKFSPVVASFFF